MSFPMRTLALLAFLLLCPALAGAGEAFLAEIEDVPLAPGLTEAPGGLVFDSPTGRIVEASASGAISADQVRSFYNETLAQLGWHSTGELQFRRDNETLKISIDPRKKPLVVHFNLTPHA
jgi:hypothetical protein